MDPELVKKILAAVKAGDSEALAAICEELLASAASGGAPAPDVAADDPAEPNADPDPEEESAAIAAGNDAAFGREVMRVLGAADTAAALANFRGLVESVNRLAADRNALEAAERLDLVARLVTAGAETPATAWVKNDKGEIPQGAARKPVKRLADEPIAELRERVQVIEASRPSRGAPLKRPPAKETAGDGRTIKTSRGDIHLSAREIKNCESQGADVNAYAENKAIRESAKSRN